MDSLNSSEVCHDMPHEIQGPLSLNGTMSLSQQKLKVLSILKKVQRRKDLVKELKTLLKVLIDIAKKVQQREDVVKELENLEKRKLIFRRGMGTAALVTTLCAVLFSFHYPRAPAAALVFLTFLQFVMQLIENTFKDEQEKLKVKMEKLTADSSMLDEIGNVVGKLKVEFKSQDFILMANETDNQEIIKKIEEHFTRILEKKG